MAALFLVNQKVIQPSMTYKTAESLMMDGNYEEAIEKFSELENYKDAPGRILEAKYMLAGNLVEEKEYDAARKIYKELGDYQDAAEKEKSAKELQYAVGNIVLFGTYEQDDNLENGAEPIEWIVLERDGENAFLLSKYALDAKPYNDQERRTTWEECTLRKWLNEDFLNTAFTEERQQIIQLRRIDNSIEEGTPVVEGQNDTMDKVFLLSWKEAIKDYREDQDVRFCKVTQKVLNTGIKTEPLLGDCCAYWLRSIGPINDTEMVQDASWADFLGVTRYPVGVRPALWINLNNSIV